MHVQFFSDKTLLQFSL